jgi:acyl-CoA oxidase
MYLAESPERAEFLMKVRDVVEKDPILQNKKEWYSWTREEKVADVYKRMNRFKEIKKEMGLKLTHKQLDDLIFLTCQGQVPIVLHYYMFKLMIKNLGTDEQKAKWLPDIDALRLHGCYC